MREGRKWRAEKFCHGLPDVLFPLCFLKKFCLIIILLFVSWRGKRDSSFASHSHSNVSSIGFYLWKSKGGGD